MCILGHLNVQVEIFMLFRQQVWFLLFRLQRNLEDTLENMALIAVYLGIGTVSIRDVLPVKHCTILSGWMSFASGIKEFPTQLGLYHIMYML